MISEDPKSRDCEVSRWFVYSSIVLCGLLESVGHAAARLPALPGHAAVALDDDCEHLLLPRHDVHDLDLAVLEAEDEVAAAPGHLPQPRQCVLAIFIPGVLKWKECATCVNSNMFK